MKLSLFIALLSILTPQSVLCQNFGFRPPLLGSGFPGVLGQLNTNPYSQFGNFGNYGNYGNQHQHQQQQDDVMTCVHSNPQDPSSLIRLTITRQHMSGPVSPLLMYGRQRNNDVPQDWQIDGYFKPGTLSPVTGPMQVVVTQYGRVQDGCNAAALGPAVDNYDNAFSPAALLTPFFPSRQSRTPAGHLHNPLYVTQGGLTIYSARLRGVSPSQLLGGGMGICPRVSPGSGECLGAVLECCSITRDQLPASRVYLNPTQTNLGVGVGVGNALPFPGANVGFGRPFGGGVTNSIPFAINTDDFLAFTDPNAAAALAANSDTTAREQSSAESEGPVDSSSSSSSSSSEEGFFLRGGVVFLGGRVGWFQWL